MLKTCDAPLFMTFGSYGRFLRAPVQPGISETKSSDLVINFLVSPFPLW